MQQLRDKLAVAERTAKAEAQLKVSKLINLFTLLAVKHFSTFDLPLDFLGKIPSAI